MWRCGTISVPPTTVSQLTSERSFGGCTGGLVGQGCTNGLVCCSVTDWNDPSSFAHNTIEIEGLPIHYVEAGKGPLVLLLHGFPYTWFEWRHQIAALAKAGYRVIAPDIRGFGTSGKPPQTEDYTLLHCAGDAIGLLRALGAASAVVVGHDLGAWVAATTARMRPDMVRGLALISTPVGAREAVRPSVAWAAMEQSMEGKLYHDYFQQPGLAESELDHDLARSLRGIFHAISGDAQGAERWRLFIKPGECLLDPMPDPAHLPASAAASCAGRICSAVWQR